MKPITWAQLTRNAVTVSEDPRPDAPANSVIYRCGHVWFRHKQEWRTACLKRGTPGQHCACNQHAREEEEAAA